MTPDTLFMICNNGVIPAWLLLVFAPSSVGSTTSSSIFSSELGKFATHVVERFRIGSSCRAFL